MNSERGLLESRTAAAVVGLCLSFVAAISWLGITKPTSFPRDPFHILGLAFSVFITSSIAYRSHFAGDRVVFGLSTAAFVLVAITAAFSLAPSMMSIVAVAKALMWTTAAVTSVILLMRGFGQ
jgi:hypothetical protein